MNEQEFKKHIQDLADGNHHPEEHDWENSERRSASDESKTTRTRAKAAGTRSRSSRGRTKSLSKPHRAGA